MFLAVVVVFCLFVFLGGGVRFLHLALISLVQCCYNPPHHMRVTIEQGTCWHIKRIFKSVCTSAVLVSRIKKRWDLGYPVKDYLVPLYMLCNFTCFFLFFHCFVLLNVLSVLIWAQTSCRQQMSPQPIVRALLKILRRFF